MSKCPILHAETIGATLAVVVTAAERNLLGFVRGIESEK